MQYYIDIDENKNITARYRRKQRKDQICIDIDDDKIKNILDYSLSESGALEISSKKQKEKHNAEIYKQLEQADKLCSSRTIREGLLYLGYKGYNSCLEKAEQEAQALREQLQK